MPGAQHLPRQQYRLDVPATWRVFHELNVERLRQYLRGSAGPGPAQVGTRDPPAAAEDTVAPAGPDRSSGCSTEFRMRYGRPHWHVLVPWAGRDAAASSDTWEPLEWLTN